MNKHFYEVNVTTMSKPHLAFILNVISNRGWDKYIEDLEMTLDDDRNIIVRGWATKANWNHFYNEVINSDLLDYVFENELD